MPPASCTLVMPRRCASSIAGADRGEAIFTGRLRRGRAHQRHRRFLQRAGRLAGARILDDDAVGGGLGAGESIPASFERPGVGPAGVPVIGNQVRRAIGHERVEQLPRRHGAAERLVVPAAAGDPLALGMRFRPDANRVLDLFERGGVAETDLIERQAAADQVRVRVVEAGHHRADLGVDDGGLRAAQPLNLAVRSDAMTLLPRTATASASSLPPSDA